MIHQVSIQVHGRVQGVYYRASTKKKADQLGLSGTVQNQEDGSVLILVRGQREVVDKLITWCAKGPPMARVDRVDVREDDRKIPVRFEICY